MSHLKIFKSNTIPTNYESSAIYFVKEPSGLLNIYITDKNSSIIYRSYGSSDISSIVNAIINSLLNQPGGLAGLDLDGNIIGEIVQQASIDGQNTSIMSNNAFVWDSMYSNLYVRSFSVSNAPTWGTLYNGIQGLLFNRSTMNQATCEFILPYNIAENTIIYPVIHTMPLTGNNGGIRWGIEYSITKSNGIDVYGTSTIVYQTVTISSGTAYSNVPVEFTGVNAIPATKVEPNSIIKMRVFRDAAAPSDTFNSDIHAAIVSLKFQTSRLGTRNRNYPYLG